MKAWQRYSGFALPLLLLLLWQGLASAGVVQPMVLPSPLAVAERWWAANQQGAATGGSSIGKRCKGDNS